MSALAKRLSDFMRHAGAPKVPPGVVPPPVRELRAKMMGFDTEALRAGTRPLDPNSGSDIKFFTDDVTTADSYLPKNTYDEVTGAFIGDNPTYREGSQVAKVKLKLGNKVEVDAGGKPWSNIRISDIKTDKVREIAETRYGTHGALTTDEVARIAKELKYDSVEFRNVKDHKSFNNDADTQPATVYAVLKPHNIRSKWAKFDPRDALKADMLAGVGGGAVVAGTLGQQQRSEYQ